MPGLLGAQTAASINLAAQLLLLAGLVAGFVLARRQRFELHGNVQTSMVLLNLLLIAFVMIPSFYGYVIAGGTTTGIVAQLMIGHGLLGVAVEIVALYLILRMRTQVIPKRLRIGNVKGAMRVTLALWAVLVALGIGIYAERYVLRAQVASAPLAEFRQLGADLYVHAVELDDAATRGSDAAVKRHAEHLINLIEGKNGLHYGDNNADGHLEDPGDGVGLLARLDAVAAATRDPSVAGRAAGLRDELDDIVSRSLDVLGLPTARSAQSATTEIASMARQANAAGVFEIDLAVTAAGVAQAPGLALTGGHTGEASSVTVHENNYQFIPGQMTIPVGTTVVWVNDEQAKHTVTADNGQFDSGDQPLGESFAYTFEQPGSYSYFCRYHGDVGGVGMAGSITLQ